MQPINTCTVPEVGWVDLSNDQRGVIPGWGRQSSEDTEHHHDDRFFMYHIEQEHRESGCHKTECCGDTKKKKKQYTHVHTHTSILERLDQYILHGNAHNQLDVTPLLGCLATGSASYTTTPSTVLQSQYFRMRK